MVFTLYSPMSHELPIAIKRSWFNFYPDAFNTLSESMLHPFAGLLRFLTDRIDNATITRFQKGNINHSLTER